MHSIRVATILGFTLITQAAWAQVTVTNSCPADAPIVLRPGPAPIAGEHAVVSITNTGTKPITGIILTWKETDSSGTFYPQTSTVDFAPSGKVLAPGGTIETEADLRVDSGKAVSSVEVTCLAVLFTGRDTWGEKRAPEVDHMVAQRQGVSSERKRLLNIYKNEGTARLIDELSRPVVR